MNKFAEILTNAHVTCKEDGENRVLVAKTAKELLALAAAGKLKVLDELTYFPPGAEDLNISGGCWSRERRPKSRSFRQP